MPMARQPLPLEEGVCGAMLHHRSFQPNAASPDHQIMTGSGAKPQPTPSRAQIHPLCHKHAARPHPKPKRQPPSSARHHTATGMSTWT